ncbi:ABC transporter permease [Arthrobacter sp. FW306-04-A]|uniref:ABC transporter permease n=1 Tax=Arthrobacter sp. FW306-04-A TaxID=2879619 RepID=UPI0037BFB986|nr:ABC transporter permease subunit [Arthrobacter sp. FW306-04-A]
MVETIETGNMAATGTLPLNDRQRKDRKPRLRWARSAFNTGLVFICLALLWEAYKGIGRATGDRIPGTQMAFPIPTTDDAMPHLVTILNALLSPSTRGGGQILLAYYLDETSVTLRESLYGVLLGGIIGVLVAVVLRESRFLTRGVLPWLVVSQTIPLVALAPLMIVWVGATGAPSWLAITFVAAYLSFFSVTVNMLTGLNSPAAVHLELMRSLACPRWFVLLRLRLPAALPSLFTGLRLAATAAVVGAVTGELTAGTGRGIGRAILTAAYYYSNSPENLFAAVLVAALAGVLFVQLINAVEYFTLRTRRA